jgi:hypothetical protein
VALHDITIKPKANAVNTPGGDQGISTSVIAAVVIGSISLVGLAAWFYIKYGRKGKKR